MLEFSATIKRIFLPMLIITVFSGFFLPGGLSIASAQSGAVSDNGEQQTVAAVDLVAQAGLVNCGRETTEGGDLVNPCDWEDFMQLINDLITWLIGIATIVATLLFMYAGFLYLTSAGSDDQTEQAKTIFLNVAVGFGIILIAWLLVTTIVSLLTGEGWIEDNSELLPISLDTELYEQFFT